MMQATQDTKQDMKYIISNQELVELLKYITEEKDTDFFKDITDKYDKKVVLSLDYDNCTHVLFDYIKRRIKICSRTKITDDSINKIILPLRLLFKKLDNQYKEINVVCGSARQTNASDILNREIQITKYSSCNGKFPGLICNPDEGFAFSDFQKLVTDIQKSPNTNSQWNFWPFLFADGFDKEDGYTISSKSSKDKYLEELDPDMKKTDLIKFQILRAKQKFKSDNFDFVFVDDKKDILDAIKTMVENQRNKSDESVWLPPTVNVYLYYYSWYKKVKSSLDENPTPILFVKL